MMQIATSLEYYGGLSITTLSLATIVALFFALKLRRPKNFPPGPQGLPMLGYTPFLGENAAETLMKMKEEYGRVFSVQIGWEYWVVLNDYDVIKDTLVKRSGTFSGRPYRYFFQQISGGYGIIDADYGEVWKNLNKLGLSAIRRFGIGKKDGEDKVVEEMKLLVDNLFDEDNKETIIMKLTLATSNMLCLMVLGTRFDYDDEKFVEINRVARQFLAEDYDAKLLGVVSLAPAIRHVPPFRGALGRNLESWGKINDRYRAIVKQHKEDFDENNPRDFIDNFLKEIKKRGENDPIFNEEQLVIFIRDIFEAGAGTTSTAVAWIILCFLNHPECQDKIAEEVENVLGEDRTPSMSHRDEMPYTCAFIHELMRYKTLLPLSVTHKTNADTTIDGYNIPKNTVISPNILSVHMDPKLFENPEEFRPERFIDENGKFVKSNHVIPFSVGPRKCLGEQLARVELFIFLTGIVQKMEILPDPDNPAPSFDVTDLPNFFTLEPPDFTAKFEKRHFA